ncbi:MAG: hypothetical protein PVS3B1_09450 [Ktedonobacteraceae bacterium]
MQEPEQNLITNTDVDTVEIEQEDDETLGQPRSPWFYVIWAVVILFIIGFAIFGITTLMHIPPTIEKSTGLIPSVAAFQAFVAIHAMI